MSERCREMILCYSILPASDISNVDEEITVCSNGALCIVRFGDGLMVVCIDDLHAMGSNR